MGDPAITYVRRDVWTLPPWDPATLWYAKAVQAMLKRDPNTPTSWRFQAAIHGSYAPVPSGATWNQCQHQTWFFVAWHRMYVYFFERIVRAAIVAAGGPADWALPYWNYDRPYPSNTLPPAFRATTLPDGTPNPLYVPSPGRVSAYNKGAQLDPRVTSDAVAMDANHTHFSVKAGAPIGSSFGGAQTPFSHFGPYQYSGQLELQPHNNIHSTLGGTVLSNCSGGWMSDPNCAAADPIFWLHHSNIDRLWLYWVNLGGGRANPPETTWLNQKFSFYDENGKPVTLTCGDVTDIGKLGYTYA